jgi:hypothetical protein
MDTNTATASNSNDTVSEMNVHQQFSEYERNNQCKFTYNSDDECTGWKDLPNMHQQVSAAFEGVSTFLFLTYVCSSDVCC